jgi:acyl carrier protein
VRQTFEQGIAQALQIHPDEAAAVSAMAIAEHIESYRQSIGEVEQTLAGADETVDEWLKLESKPSVFSAANPTAASSRMGANIAQLDPSDQRDQLVQSDRSALKQTRALENWMIQWLSKQLKISPAQIDPAKAFADYGLDSVMAVELAQDLGDFLKLAEPLEVTLAWNFPTIQALASRLASMPSDLGNPEKAQGDAGFSAERAFREDAFKENTFREDTSREDAFSDLSEAEAAHLLAMELATVRRTNP